jgi:hypothetical protein
MRWSLMEALGRSGDVARRGVVSALSHRCCLLLGCAPAAVSMKGPRWLRIRGPGMGAAVVAKGSQHDNYDGVLAVAGCTPVGFLMAVQR